MKRLAIIVTCALVLQGRARAEITQKDLETLVGQGAEEWQLTLSFSEVQGLEESQSWTGQIGATAISGSTLIHENMTEKLQLTGDAATFNHIKGGAHKGDFSWNLAPDTLDKLTLSVTGTGAHDYVKHSVRSGMGRALVEDWTSHGKMAPKGTTLGFSIQPEHHTWRLSGNFSYPDEKGSAPGGPVDAPQGGSGDLSLDEKVKGATLTPKGKGFVIDYTLTDDHTVSLPMPPGFSSGSGTRKTIHEVTVHAEIKPRTAKYLAILVPNDPAGYPRWLPAGPSSADQAPLKMGVGELKRAPGRDIKFQVEVHDALSGVLITKPRTTHFQITDTSHAPGSSMNFPAFVPGPVDATDDLVFEAAQNGGGAAGITVTARNLVYQDSVPYDQQIATVSSNDWGSYGHLKAEVLIDGQPVEVKFHDGAKTELAEASIPQDDNGNHIADWWEKDPAQEGDVDQAHPEVDISSPKRESSWELDAEPSDGAPQNFLGDGLTLYEEYRGFEISKDGLSAPVHVRLSPRWKEFFVYLPQGTPAEAQAIFIKGARLYEAISKLRVRFINVDQGVAPIDGPGAKHKHPWINFNSDPATPADFGPKQFAITIRDEKWTPVKLFGKPCHLYYTDPSTGHTKVTEDDGITPLKTFPERKEQATHRMDDDDQHNPEAPEDVYQIVVHRSEIELAIRDWMAKLADDCYTGDGMKAYYKAHNTSGAIMLAKITPPVLKDLVRKRAGWAIAHELRHAMGGYHHSHWDPATKTWQDRYTPTGSKDPVSTVTGGDTNCPLRYWIDEVQMIMAFLDGTWDMSDPAQGLDGKGGKIPWQFHDANDVGWGKGVPKLHK